MRPALFGFGLGAVLLAAAITIGAQSASVVVRLLTQELEFSSADVRALDAGTAVIRTLDTSVREELAHVGAVYIDAPAARFIERFRDIERFERGTGIPQIGRFESPPRIADLRSLTLPDADIDALQACRRGDCDVKLSTAWMERFSTEVDWASPTAAGQANELVREMLFELVRAYQREGNAALGQYDDGGESLSVTTELRALLARQDSLPAPVPELIAYLDNFPDGRPDGAEDFFYWTVVDFGLKPTIRVNHVTIYPLPAGVPSGVTHAMVIKQLYASHYFHTTLELRFLIDDDRRSDPHVVLISLTRSRSDGMTGFKGLFLRPIISRRSRDAVRGYLEHVKRQVERPDGF